MINALLLYWDFSTMSILPGYWALSDIDAYQKILRHIKRRTHFQSD